MSSITKRELNQHTATALAKVSESDDLIITERGSPRWRVSAYRADESGLKRLERAGDYIPPPGNPPPWPSEPGGPAYTSTEADALIDEIRGDH